MEVIKLSKKEHIEKLLIALDSLRESLSKAKDAKKSLEEQPAYIAASRTVKTHSDAIKPIESRLRALGLELYKEKGEKDIAFGMKHKTETGPTIVDQVAALEYCRDKFFDGLSLDIKALEKHAKTSKYPLPFIKFVDVDKISIPKKIKLD